MATYIRQLKFNVDSIYILVNFQPVKLVGLIEFLFYVRVDNISFTYVTAHRITGELKKFDLWSISNIKV